jgi:hypothetical protein
VIPTLSRISWRGRLASADITIVPPARTVQVLGSRQALVRPSSSPFEFAGLRGSHGECRIRAEGPSPHPDTGDDNHSHRCDVVSQYGVRKDDSWGPGITRSRAPGAARREGTTVPILDLDPAAREVARLLDGVTDDQLAGPTPCTDTTVAALLDHLSSAYHSPSPGQPARPPGRWVPATGQIRGRQPPNNSIRTGAPACRSRSMSWPTLGGTRWPGRG